MAPLPANDPAVVALDRLAAQASLDLAQQVTRAVPRDSALGWKGGAVHPLQVLATQYPAIVYDAVRGITDPEERKQSESRALGQFFFFDVGTPRLLGVSRDGAYAGRRYPLPSDQLQAVRRKLKEAQEALGPPADAADVQRARDALLAAWTIADGLLGAFLQLPGSAMWPVAPVVAAGQELGRLDQAIPTATAAQLPSAVRHIGNAADHLDQAVSGVGTVQMFYPILGFYLFRLLVRGRLRSDRAISAQAAAEASGKLTELLANGHPWLSDWLRDKIVDLSARIAAADPSGNTLFFLKGGRAIRYLEGQPQLGRNDWDTQIVINPNLPPAAWYALFLRISNEVLLALGDYKLEFYMLLNRHSQDFLAELQQAADAADADEDDEDEAAVEGGPADPWEDPAGLGLQALFELMDEEDAPGPHEANCKGELIDVGLPRYDSVEGIEQWAQLRGDILVAPDRIPYPGHLYYVNEYLLMLREVFAGASPSARKAPSRTQRLYSILALPGTQAAIDTGSANLQQLLPLSLNQVAQEPDVPTRYALKHSLVQFAFAYGLEKEPTLAAAFDAWLQPRLQGLVPQVPWPPAFLAAIQDLGNGWTPGNQRLGDAVAFCQRVSNEMEAHFATRARRLSADPALTGFIRCFCDNSLFSSREELELQLAIVGSYAAAQQAGYSQYRNPQDLDAVTYASMGLYTPLENADPAVMLEMVSPIVDQCLGGGQLLPPIAPYVADGAQGNFTRSDDPQDHAIRLYWPEMTIAPFTYTPLAVEIVAEADPARPLLSWIWGLPMLGLPDLIRQYRRSAAETEEYGRRSRTRDTAASLADMMTSAANPEPPNPAIAALRDYRCSHLMISSASNAAARSAAYPRSYYV